MITIKKVLFFDLDGTLVKSVPTILETFRKVFSEIDIQYPGDDILTAGIGSHLTRIFSPLVPKNLVGIATDAYRKIYLKKQRQGEIQLLCGVKDVLEELLQEGRRMGIVTTKCRVTSEELLLQFHAKHFFEVIVGSEDVKHCKPNPEPLFLAAERLKVFPEDCVYIGDSLHDGKAAKAAHMEFIGVLTGTGKKEELEKFGKVYKSLSEVVKDIRKQETDNKRQGL